MKATFPSSFTFSARVTFTSSSGSGDDFEESPRSGVSGGGVLDPATGLVRIRHVNFFFFGWTWNGYHTYPAWPFDMSAVAFFLSLDFLFTMLIDQTYFGGNEVEQKLACAHCRLAGTLRYVSYCL